MKMVFGMLMGTLVCGAAWATDGRSTGCFDVAVSVPKTFTAGEPQGTVYIKTGAVLCVTEKNMKAVDADEIVSTGEITIRVRENGRTSASYKLGARSSEGAAGTIYTSYGATVTDVSDQKDENNYKLATFKMRNDHIKRGEGAGAVALFGTELILFQR